MLSDFHSIRCAGLKMNTWISVALFALFCFFQKGDAITGWSTPTITGANGAGALSVPENQALHTEIETYVATGGTGAVTYSLDSAVSPFAVAPNGTLTITAALDFETTPSYTLSIKAVDSATQALSGTATITVTVTDVNEAPTFSSATYTPCVVHNSGEGTTVTTVTATDVDTGNSVTYGGSDSNFKINSTTGVITVEAGITLTTANSPYTFNATATDNALTTAVTVTVTVADSCSSAVGVAVSMMTLLAALFVYMF